MKKQKGNFDGIKAAAELLNQLDPQHRQKLVDSLEQRNPELTSKIKDQMFVFEDLIKIDSRDMQKLLREVAQPRLALALRNASPDLKDHVFKNLSARGAQILKEELEGLGPRRLTDVQAAQNEIIALALRLKVQ